MTKIKICGLWRPPDILAANQALPDYIGFVFAESRRWVSPGQAAELKRLLSPSIKAVGVFVNAPAGDVVSIVKSGTIDLVQLHGDEDEAYIRLLKREITVPVIKAVRVRTPEDIWAADTLPCDDLLLDTYVAGSCGGSGCQFDWSLIPSLSHPFFLAGGLCERNLRAAAQTGAFCLDLSSAAETDGVKDPEKIMKIVRLIRSI